MAGIDEIVERLGDEEVALALRVSLILLVGFVAARLGRRLAGRIAQRRGTAQQVLIARRVVYYAVLVLTLLSAMGQLGVQLGVLLGAAGVLTVAIGFASQTSASNVISGLFLLGERPFVVGDTIRVGDTTGEVLSIDLLSVKLRTPDNLYVRVPNESLIKSEIVNLTRFPIRRIEVGVEVARQEDLERVARILLSLAERTPECLREPAPGVTVQGFGAAGVQMRLWVWTRAEGFLELRTRVLIGLKKSFDAEGVAIAFAQGAAPAARPVVPGSATPPPR